MRAKGDGRDANKKWFSGEVFAWFVEGSATSPGLAENVASIMDIIYLRCPAPPPAAPPPAAAPPAAAPPPAGANRTQKNGGGGAKKRVGGFTVGAAAAPPPTLPQSRVRPAAVPHADTPLEAKLRERYGSHMDVVLLGLNAWSAFAQVYAEWREPWVERSTAYAQRRALAFLRHACALSSAMKAVSLGKHKS